MTDGRQSYSWDRHGAKNAGPIHSAGQQAMLRYLARNGLIEPAAVAGPETRLSELSRSHTVWSVRLKDGRHIIVKRARPRPGEIQGTLDAEPAIYQMASAIPELGDAMPVCLLIDPWLQVLVLEAVEPGENLYLYNYSHALSREQARQLGRTMGAWHRATTGMEFSTLGSSVPWVLEIFVPGRWRPGNTDQVLVHGQVRRELSRHFAELPGLLKRSCLIHGDLKWDNCLTARLGIKVIDWEAAGVGDAAWDVAGVLQEYVAYSCFQQDHTQTGEILKECQDAFLEAYLGEVRLPDGADFLERAARLAGARLVQSALERGVSATYGGAVQVLVRKGLDCLRDPQGLIAGRYCFG